MKEFNIKGRKGAFDMPLYYLKEFTNDAIEKVSILVINKSLNVPSYTCLNLLSKAILIILVEFFIYIISFLEE